MMQSLDARAVSILNDFFRSGVYRIPSREDFGYMKHHDEFMNAARASVHEALAVQLSVVPATISEDSIELLVDGHGDTTTNEFSLLTGHSGGALSDKGISRTQQLRKQHASFTPAVHVSSDSPRTIMHDVVKYYPESVNDPVLQELVANTPASLEQNFGLITPEMQLRWIDYAMEHRVIPTPLLRAQFYGLMELFPSKEDEPTLAKKEIELLRQSLRPEDIKPVFDKLKAKLATSRQKCYELQAERFRRLGYDQNLVDYFMKAVGTSLEQRSSKTFFMVGQDGKPLTENRANLLTRVHYFLQGFFPDGGLYEAAKGKQIQIVTHSGTNDVLISDLQAINFPGGTNITKRSKPIQRGESWLVKLGPSKEQSSDLVYINDPTNYQSIVRSTYEKISELRNDSPDQAIRDGNGIMPTRLYALRRKQEQKEDEKVNVGISDIVNSPGATLILANAGLGKTMFTTDLATMLLPSLYEIPAGELNKEGMYVPNLVRLREVEGKLNESGKIGSKEEYATLKSILTGGVSDLNESTLDDFHKQGKRFVFVLDGYDELATRLKDETMWGSLIQDISELGKVIMTSRYERFSNYENGNPSFANTLNVDPEGILNNLDQYLQNRLLNSEEATRLGEYIRKQSEDIQKNWLMVYFITDLYRRDPERLDLTTEVNTSDVMKAGIEWYVWDHSRRRNSDLFKEPERDTTQDRESYWQKYYGALLEAKTEYIKEIMPSVRRVTSYIVTVKNLSPATEDEVQMILDDRWDLVTEALFREGRRKDRFITNKEYAKGVRASSLTIGK